MPGRGGAPHGPGYWARTHTLVFDIRPEPATISKPAAFCAKRLATPPGRHHATAPRLRTAEQRPRLDCQLKKAEAGIEADRVRLRVDHHTDAPKPRRHLPGQLQREPQEPRANAMAPVSRGDSQSCQAKNREWIGR